MSQLFISCESSSLPVTILLQWRCDNIILKVFCYIYKYNWLYIFPYRVKCPGPVQPLNQTQLHLKRRVLWKPKDLKTSGLMKKLKSLSISHWRGSRTAMRKVWKTSFSSKVLNMFSLILLSFDLFCVVIQSWIFLLHSRTLRERSYIASLNPWVTFPKAEGTLKTLHIKYCRHTQTFRFTMFKDCSLAQVR